MRAASFCSTALLLLFLSQGFLFRQTRSQRDDRGPRPSPRPFWDYYPDNELYYTKLLAAMRQDAKAEAAPDLPELKKKLAEALQGFVPPAKKPDSLTPALTKPGGAQDLDNPGKPQGAPFQVDKDQQKVFNGRKDGIGSSFVKKGHKKVDMGLMKRQLDQVGIGLMKRPLDHLGNGLFKKSSRYSDGEEKYFKTAAKDFHEDNFQGVNPKPGQHAYGKQSAVELLKKGLDVVGTELFKRGGEDTTGFAQIKTALDQLSKGFGNGDPGKGVDAEMVRRGLDHLGSGLLKRDLDTVGLGLIKRAVDDLDRGLMGKAHSKTLDKGLELLRKGLDQLQMDLIKDGFDQDGVNMITKGAVDLASWLIKQHSVNNSQHTTKAVHDKKVEQAKKPYYDFDSGPSKKSLDTLGTGLIKKASDQKRSDPLKHLEDVGSDSDDKDWDGFGSGLITKGHEDLGDVSFSKKFDTWYDKHKQEPSTMKKYADFFTAVERNGQEDKLVEHAEKFSKDIKPEVKEERSYDVNIPLGKKALDEIGTGFIKKDLDDVGSGLMKKKSDDLGPKEFRGPDSALHKVKPDWFKPPYKETSSLDEKTEWPKTPQTYGKSEKIPKKEYDTKTKDSLKRKHNDKLVQKSF